MDENVKMEFMIIGVNEQSFTYKDLSIIKDFDLSKTEFQFAHFYKWNEQEKFFGVFFKVFLNYKKENEKVELMNYNGAVHFSINNFHDVVHVKNNDIDMNEGLESTLVSITYSTLRGMIALRTMGTPLSQFILPIINPMELVVSRKKAQEQARNSEL